MSKKKKLVNLSDDKAIQKEFGKVISDGTELIASKQNLKTLTVSPSIDLALNGGLLEGSWNIISGDPKTGKEQPVSSIVYTPTGPIRMGDVTIGTRVCTPNGSTAKVSKIHNQGIKDVWRITFNDGSTAECGIDHLWKVGINYHGKKKWRVLSLKQIIDKGINYSDRPKFKIQLTDPVEFEYSDTLIDPYIIGCLLGDGCLVGHSVSITSIDDEIIDKFDDFCRNHKLKLTMTGKDTISYRLSSGLGSNRNIISQEIKKLGLFGKNSHTKFIPDIYKYNSIEQRLELIRGLMDADGYNDNGKSAEYSTASKQLAADVVEVLQSLGYTGKIKKRTTKCNGKKFPSYRIYVAGDDISKIFTLSRKKFDHKRSKGKLFRTIKSIDFVRKEDSRCIELNDYDHLYLTNGFVVTHNSTSCLQVCKNAQDEGRPVIYIDAESRLKTYNLVGIDGLDLEKIQIVHGPDDGEQLAAEDFLKICESMMKMPKNKGAVCVIDSCSSLVPRSELEEDPSGSIRASLPKLLSHWIKKNSQTVVKNKIIVLVITHYITNTSGYGKLKIPDCGVMVQYQADTRMDIGKIESWEESNKKIGQLVHWKIGCSSLGASGTECVSYLKFGKGIDKDKEVIELAESFSIVEKAGSWYSLEFLAGTKEFETAPKFQGQESLYNFLQSRPDIFTTVLEKVKGVLE